MAVPGFRTDSLVVVTSLLDPQEVSAEDLAALYRQRWSIELQLRDIKTMMQLDVLRRKTPARARQELWTGLLAYNLVRQSMLQSAHESGHAPCRLSFTATLQMLAATWLAASVPHPVTTVRAALTRMRIVNGRTHPVGNRPDRIEPRAVKRRPCPLDLLMVPRQAARDALLAGLTGK